MAPFDGEATTMNVACAHCAAPVAGGGRFCCTGCEAAFEVVKGLGLDAFYARRRIDPAARALRPDDRATYDYSGRTKLRADGVRELHLMVDGLTCAACVWLIETVLAREPDVVDARVNLSTGRLVLKWEGAATRADGLVASVSRLGFRLVPFDPGCLDDAYAREEADLLRATGIAGFAAGNVMMLSVAVWVGVDMGQATKDLLHWVSALIGLPCIFYAGLPFYRSAATALRAGRLNMDVPIAVGVTMTAAMSLSETIRGGPYAYFDAALTLLFFLLAGRYLDRRARGRARSSAAHLLALAQRPVTVIAADGRTQAKSAAAVTPGETVLVATGERIGVDGIVRSGRSSVDESLVTGESLPRDVAPGAEVFAGLVNLGPALTVETVATGDGTLLAEIVRLVEAAERGRSRFVAIAERVTRLYAPVVHVTALSTFLGWYFVAGAAWQIALLHAVATLIITCPCALGLAVPSVQTIASGRLMRGGILLKNATALERLAEIDTVVFDKTGTLTLGMPTLIADPNRTEREMRLAASLAAGSRHPLARALCRAVPDVGPAAGTVELPGEGIVLGAVRLGSRAFCGIPDAPSGGAAGPEIWLSTDDGRKVRFAFVDALRDDAAAAVAALEAQGIDVELLSGDRPEAVGEVVRTVGIDRWQARVAPAAKAARLAELAARGRKVLMVGDGLNDAPALAAAYASLAPATGVDVAQVASDAVFQGSRLGAVVELIEVAGSARKLVRQNIAMSIVYNAFAVPLAVLGMVTPPVAAALMSSSSIAVVMNSLRL